MASHAELEKKLKAAKAKLESANVQIEEMQMKQKAMSDEATQEELAAMKIELEALKATQQASAPKMPQFSEKPVPKMVFYNKQHGQKVEMAGTIENADGTKTPWVQEIIWPTGSHFLETTDERIQHYLLNSRQLLKLKTISVVPTEAVPMREQMEQVQDGPRYAEGAMTSSAAKSELKQTEHHPGAIAP